MLLEYVVVSTVLPIWMAVPVVNPVPVTVTPVAPAPAVTVVGEIELTVRAGVWLPPPPPLSPEPPDVPLHPIRIMSPLRQEERRR